ncbi:MAG: hypothetical protein HYV08_13140 [Deltaproteobacteria bacterium]|nr:hypothetical protein [Deltaproteobacteria bacterium]MBI3075830.1 hypothetical protein [Deltaproteobacteria bacterium]
MAVLEVTASDAQGTQHFRGERQYRNIGRDAQGLVKTAVWQITRLSEESTALRPEETRREGFAFSWPQGVQELTVQARLTYRITPAAQPVVMQEESHRLAR